jgi:hypothetical protein
METFDVVEKLVYGVNIFVIFASVLVLLLLFTPRHHDRFQGGFNFSATSIANAKKFFPNVKYSYGLVET